MWKKGSLFKLGGCASRVAIPIVTLWHRTITRATLSRFVLLYLSSCDSHDFSTIVKECLVLVYITHKAQERAFVMQPL